MLTVNKLHHIGIIIDGGPKIISFVIDGKFNDGGRERQFGWGRFSPNLRNINGRKKVEIASNLKGELQIFRIYNTPLTVSEIIANYKVGI